nr:hypothetical protein [Tanacetum cinerariifolium]
MENPNHPNDPNIPEGDQAPAAPDGFAPQWTSEHNPNNNNGRIEWDVPLGGEVDEPMVDPEVNEEVVDDDDWDDEVEWLMAPVTPPRATMTVSSTYEVGGPSTAAIEGPSFPFPAPRLPVPPTVESRVDTHPSGQMAVQGRDVIVGSSQQVQTLQTGLHETELQNQQSWTRVTEMESHVGILMSYMLWMEDRLTVLEKRLPGLPPGPQ